VLRAAEGHHPAIAGLAINPVRVCWTLRVNHWEFLRLWTGFELSSSWLSPSLAMAQRRIEVVFVLWDDLKLTSGLRIPTAFNGQNYFFKIAGSKVVDKYTTIPTQKGKSNSHVKVYY
jgi:hypothetical protein